MIQLAGSIVFIIGILVLFALDRDKGTRASKALWIPVVWLFLAGSRPVSFWLQMRMIGTSADDQLEGSPLDRAIFTALIVAALVVLAARGRKVGKLLQANGPILLFLFYCGLSSIWSDFPDVAFKRWIRVVGDFAMVSVVLTDPGISVAVERFLARTGSIIIPLSILFDIGRWFSGRGWHYGLTLNKNMYGAISMILGLGAVWRFLTMFRNGEREGRTRRLIARGSIVGMAMWCLWMADSATSTACFLLGSMLIIVTSSRLLRQRPAVVHLVVASLVLLAVYVTIINPAVGVVSTMGKDPTLTGRTELWQALIPMTPSTWFGAGFESFWLGPRLKKLWSIFVWQPNEAHNGYVEVYLNLGLTGLILLAVVLVTGYWRVVSGIRQDSAAGSLSLAYFVVAVVYSLTEVGFRIFNPIWIFFLLSITGVVKPQLENAKLQPLNIVSWPFAESRFSTRDSDSAVEEV